MSEFGWPRFLMYFGITLVIVGGILNNYPKLLRWFGNLPGDLKIQWRKYQIALPLTSMFVASAGMSLIIFLLERYLSFGRR